jgi:hypothetical protein
VRGEWGGITFGEAPLFADIILLARAGLKDDRCELSVELEVSVEMEEAPPIDPSRCLLGWKQHIQITG